MGDSSNAEAGLELQVEIAYFATTTTQLMRME